ncbi:MAG: hypothetical protein WCE38_08920 [Burkholderiales bacterium]
MLTIGGLGIAVTNPDVTLNLCAVNDSNRPISRHQLPASLSSAGLIRSPDRYAGESSACTAGWAPDIRIQS